MKRTCLLLVVMLVLAAVTGGTVFANDMTPGTYTISLKWEQGGNHYCRLAIYSFQPGGTMRSDYWEWYQGSSNSCSTSNTIGTTSQQGVPTGDSSSHVKGNTFYLGSNLAQRYGTWTLYSGGIVGITWSNGDTEYWRRTWYQTQLTKIECYYASYCTSGYQWSFYLFNNGGNFERNGNAYNAGWGFGGASTPGGTYGKTSLQTDFNADYDGLMLEWTSESTPNYKSVVTDWVCLLQYFYGSSTGVERYVSADAGMWVYAYCAIPSSPGMYSRRIMLQVSHDFNGNGNIEDDNGHIRCGLQIIDTYNNGRGMVFCQTAPSGNGGLSHIASSFCIDDSSAAAQTGICSN